MTPDQKLAYIFCSLRDAGIDGLVMGGHAVRHYGIDRNTVDFDLVTSIATSEELQSRLLTARGLESALHRPAWRSRDFARFEIGRLPDGREEWLEFWLRNHLLDSFPVLKTRAEIGTYGGEQIAFLSICDLLRSKETERESDWQDIGLLEEVQDARHFASLGSTPDGLRRLLANLRSRRGMDRAIDSHLLADPHTVVGALRVCTHPITYAFLAPFSPQQVRGVFSTPIDPAILTAIRTVSFGSARHFALVEVIRRAYKRHAMEIDRADKQAKLRQQ